MINPFYKILFISNVFILFISAFSCNHLNKCKTERSFYYWKTTYSFDKKDMAYADSLDLHHVYIKCFDVDWSANLSKPIPLGIINSSAYMDMPFETATPCVFITNKVMENSSNEELDILAEKISEKMNNVFIDFAKSYAYTVTGPWHDSVYAKGNTISEKFREEVLNKIDSAGNAMERDWLLRSNEIQIDCDWTAKTREKFFYFLKKIKSHFPEKTISCTLRLWQFNNSKKAGIPPVDRCMLMCYSVGSPKKYNSKNSISNADDLKTYLHRSKYPLPLDIALPVYSWGVLYHNGEFKGLLRNVDTDAINKDTLNLKLKSKNLYGFINDTIIENTYVRFGDELKIEKVDAEELQKIIDLIDSRIYLANDARIAFFSWDTTYIKQYGIKNFEKYYSSFN